MICFVMHAALACVSVYFYLFSTVEYPLCTELCTSLEAND